MNLNRMVLCLDQLATLVYFDWLSLSLIIQRVVCVCVRTLEVTPTKTTSPGKIFHIHSVDWCGRSARRLRGVEGCTIRSWLERKGCEAGGWEEQERVTGMEIR